MSEAPKPWDGIPVNPEAAGWHWLSGRPHYWSGESWMDGNMGLHGAHRLYATLHRYGGPIAPESAAGVQGLPATCPAVPYAEQATELRREIAQRERVYPRWVTDRKMTQQAADRQMARLRAALQTVEAADAAGRLI